GYAVTDALQIRLGTGLAGNIIDYILYGIIPKSTNYLLLIPVGAVFFVVQYCLFRFFITKFDIKTPGREDDDDLENDSAVAADETGVVLAAKMIEYLGGKDNIKTLTNCFTRVRTTVKDKSAVQKDKFKTLGAKGVTEPSEDGLQVIFGPQSEKIVNNMKRVMNRIVTVPKEAVLIVNDTLTDTADICGKEDFVSPATGKLIPLSQVKDPVFAEKTLGDGFAVEPIDSRIVSPVNGTIAMVFPTKHAVAITSDLGKEMLIHMGIDTVELNGKGFEILVKEGDTVETGTPIAKMDLSLLRKEGKDTVIPVIMTNSGEKTVRVSPYGEVKEGQVIDFDVQ
ncbi:MAG TPA: glucose PTS transporter subunit IIA, partial [Candidatus Mediterraneibacter intestinigallinarum]|nr:glucose PTS transporter subunit IIA [Candidatus Mediterraneibacter intestinigallinarum]